MLEVSALEREIREQPTLLSRRRREAQEPADRAGRLLGREDVTHLVVVGRGSSDNAARFAQYLLGRSLNLAVYLGAPSLFSSGSGPDLRGAAVLGVSQSGQSPDVVAVLEAARRQGRPTLAITNDTSAPLARWADVTVPLLVGTESSVAATKTYVATLQSVVQLAVGAGGTGMNDWLDRLPDLMAGCIEAALAAEPPLVDLVNPADAWAERLTTVGRGTGFATAAETALKIREVSGLRAEAFPLPDLLHGPIAANGSGTSLWVVASPSYPLDYWDQLTARLAAEDVRVTALVPGAGQALTAHTLHHLPEGLPAWLFDLIAVTYGQVAALRLGQQLGRDLDHPHGLSKVTRTS
jgi:glucosamine--fructose-6-phosphate aminotransferase (isomerizing)